MQNNLRGPGGTKDTPSYNLGGIAKIFDVQEYDLLKNIWMLPVGDRGVAVAALLILGVQNVDGVGHRARVAARARSPENDGWTD